MDFDNIEELDANQIIDLYDNTLNSSEDKMSHCWGTCYRAPSSAYVCVISGTNHISFAYGNSYCMYLCYAWRINGCVADSYTGYLWENGNCPNNCR